MNCLRSFAESVYAELVLRRLTNTPKHVAIIQDGNRRYAKEHGMSVDMGHKLGADTTLRVLEWMKKLGIKHITFYAFSTENFKRDADEVDGLMELFVDKFTEMLSDARVVDNKINVTVVGDRTLIPPHVLEKIEAVEEKTKDFNDYYVHFALAYGGRNEIVETAKRVVSAYQNGEIALDEITPEKITESMYPAGDMPPVDLILRTANDRRTSNFLPWLANGNEAAVCFCVPTWPEFRYVDMVRALRTYDERMKA
ncbi:MAG: di-trans,poly-cis-decaprenylcistransferase [Methanocorpusculum sp.]|nr:di-trans,poly-cis-decaprenylcistransferase [Methanocorpusculum sp.]MEE1136041.1 polyprenyl diphosphate synthase [Methanocorpusculum sp.]HJJ68276.1 polyprenyl diphosphate synthase [Methanocorpusculum sp.]